MRKLARGHPVKFWLGAWVLAGMIGMGLGAITKQALAQTSPCQASTTGAVGGIPCQRLPGRFFAPGAGTGVETEALLGFNVTDVSAASGTLSIDYNDSAGDPQTLDFAGAEDGVLASATWSTANQTLTLTLADGTTMPVALSGLETQAEVTAAINCGARQPRLSGRTSSRATTSRSRTALGTRLRFRPAAAEAAAAAAMTASPLWSS